MEDILSILSRFEFFAGLDRDELQLVYTLLKPSTLEQGENLFVEGSEGESLFFLIGGKVKISQKLALLNDEMATELRNKTLVTLDAGHYPCFGEIGLLKKGIRSATVTAVDDCNLLELSRESLHHISLTSPETGVKILFNLSVMICNRLETANMNVLKLTTALSIALS